MPFDKGIYYLLVALAFGIAALVLIPKKQYKKFFIYGLLFGGILDMFIIIIFSGLFQLFKYFYIGSFSILGLFSFWTPIAWIFTFMIYLYFLPVRKIFLYPYVTSFIAFGYMVGQAFKGIGLFKFYDGYLYFMPFTFIIWFSLAAWAYIKGEKITLR